MNSSGTLIVSWDFSHEKDYDILFVGKQDGTKLEVINMILDEDARDIYKRLTTVKGEKS